MANKDNQKDRVIAIEDHKNRKQHDAPVPDFPGVQFRKIPMADLIRTYRKQAKISQQELGDKLGVTRNTVVNWEAGKYRPDIDLLLPLCSLFGITLYQLFGAEDQTLGISTHERQLLDGYRQISSLSQRIVDRMVNGILDEEAKDRDQQLVSRSHLVGILEVTAAAGNGFGFSDIPMEDCSFVFLNDQNKKADAILRIRGNSMTPLYHSGDMVYVQFTQSPDIGEDVICRSDEGFHIKRLGKDGPYSLNPDEPFTLTSPGDNVETIGRVLGIVNKTADLPTGEESDLLRDLRREDVEAFREKYNLTES